MTSGTTGVPLVFGYDRGSEYWRQAMKLRGYAWAGYRPGDKSLHFWGSAAALHPPPLSKRLKVSLDHSLRRELYVDCTERSEQALDDVTRLIRKRKPEVMLCYAQAGVALARHVVEKGSRDWPDLRVICAAERLFPADREVLREAFGPEIFETYGSREVMLIAAECEAHSGMHVSMENLVVEVVVRDDAGAAPGAARRARRGRGDRPPQLRRAVHPLPDRRSRGRSARRVAAPAADRSACSIASRAARRIPCATAKGGR